MSKPTLVQIEFFKDYDLALPPSKEVADTLMVYVNFGNALYESGKERTSVQRAEILREAQGKWIGKRVIRYSNGRDGVSSETEVFVYHLSARSKAEMRNTLEKQDSLLRAGLTVRMPDRFKAIISTKGRFVGLEWLRDPK